MAAASHKLPGNSGLGISLSELHRASVDASDMARQLAQAEFASPAAVENILEECQRAVVRIGHSLGYVFTEAKRFSGERASQRLEAEMAHKIGRHVANTALRAASADLWRARAETAEETVRNLTEELERARAPHRHLIAAE